MDGSLFLWLIDWSTILYWTRTTSSGSSTSISVIGQEQEQEQEGEKAQEGKEGEKEPAVSVTEQVNKNIPGKQQGRP